MQLFVEFAQFYVIQGADLQKRNIIWKRPAESRLNNVILLISLSFKIILQNNTCLKITLNDYNLR